MAAFICRCNGLVDSPFTSLQRFLDGEQCLILLTLLRVTLRNCLVSLGVLHVKVDEVFPECLQTFIQDGYDEHHDNGTNQVWEVGMGDIPILS